MPEATETADVQEIDRLKALGKSEADFYASWLAGTSGEKLSPFALAGLAHSFGFVMDKAALAAPPVPVTVTEEMVAKAHKAVMAELFMICQPDKGDIFAFMDDHPEVIRAALTAAFTSP